MGVDCRIMICKPRNGVFRAGGTVRGVVKYSVDKSSEFKDVTLSLIGRGYCRWVEHSSDTTEDTYTGTEEFINCEFNIVERKESQCVVIPVGSYDFHFEFILPSNLPSSYRDKYCTIGYYLKVKFVKLNLFSFSRKFETELNVYGNILPIAPEGPIVYGIEKHLLKLFTQRRHVIKVNTQIEKSLLMPGENLEVRLFIINDTDVIIPCMKIELINETTYRSNCGKKRIERTTLKQCTATTPVIFRYIQAELVNKLAIPPEAYSIQHAKVMTKEYRVKVTVKLPLPHIDASLEMPIAVGERIGSDSDLGVLLLEDEPPSYAEVIAEDILRRQ